MSRSRTLSSSRFTRLQKTGRLLESVCDVLRPAVCGGGYSGSVLYGDVSEIKIVEISSGGEGSVLWGDVS